MTHPSGPGPRYTIEEAEDHVGDLRGKVDRLIEAHTKTNATDQPNTPASGLISYSFGGHEKYVSADGNAYNTGRLSVRPSSALTLTSSYQTVAGLTVALAIGEWRVRSQILLNPTVSGGTPSYQYDAAGSGLVLSHGRLTITEVYATNQVGIADWPGDGTLPGAQTSNGAIGAGLADRIIVFDGWLIVSTAGTLSIQAKLSSGAGTIVLYGSYLEAMPVT